MLSKFAVKLDEIRRAFSPYSLAWANSAQRYGHLGTRPWINDFNLINRLEPEPGLTQLDIGHLQHVLQAMRGSELGDLAHNTEPDAIATNKSLTQAGRANRHAIDAMNRLRAQGLA